MSYSDILRIKNLGNFSKLLTNPLYRPILVTDGLVLYLDGRDFTNSPPTTTWIDRSGLGNNAIPSGFAYTTASGSDGVGGVVFDGVDDKVISTLPTYSLSNISIELNFNLKTLSKTPYILNTNDSGVVGANPILFWSSSSQKIAYNSTNTPNRYLTYPILIDTFYHIVITINNNSVVIKINNQIVDSFLDASFVASTKLFISSNLNFEGKVKTLRVYNRALTDLEIAQNYNASK